MSWYGEGGEGTNTSAETGQETGTETSTETSTETNLAGKPEWMPDSFWIAPEAEKEADWQAMAKKLAGSAGESRKKIGEQGELLKKYTVPDSVTPYFEGLDKGALVKAHERSGLDEAQIEQFMAQARSAGIGPEPARALLQSWAKSRHEATEAPKTPAQLAEAGIAELNAAGRPGSEIGQRVKGYMARLVAEEKISKAGAEALMPRNAAGWEALNAMMGLTRTGTGPAGSTSGTSHATETAMDELRKEMADPKFGDGGDPAYTARVMKKMLANKTAIVAKHRAEVEQLERMSLGSSA